jgi:hypothetical protein
MRIILDETLEKGDFSNQAAKAIRSDLWRGVYSPASLAR